MAGEEEKMLEEYTVEVHISRLKQMLRMDNKKTPATILCPATKDF